MKTLRRAVIGVTCMSIITGLSWLTISQGVPSVLRPMNLVVVLPIFWSYEFPGGPYFLAPTLLAPAIFCVWCARLIFTGSSKVPIRSYTLLAAAQLLSIIAFLTGGSFALGYHGARYVIGTGLISAVWWFGLGGLAYSAGRRPSFGRNLEFHVLLFAWLAWYAVPYLGEVP